MEVIVSFHQHLVIANFACMRICELFLNLDVILSLYVTLFIGFLLGW